MSKFQEITEEIVNIFKVRPLLNVIILLVASLLISYEIISEIFLPIKNENYNEIVFSKNILFFVFMILGIIIYTQLMKYRIDYDKYFDVISKINFDSSHLGTDGLCCFLTHRDEGVYLPKDKNRLLITSAFTQKADKDETMEDIIENNNIAIYAHSTSCSKLVIDSFITNDNLTLRIYCKDYENRPQPCKDYPVLNSHKICRLGQCCSSPIQQVEEFKWVSTFFYALDKKKYPELEKFSVGVAQNFFHRYFLIPVPFRCKEYENILCEHK